jgi:hypothetical protein
LNRFAKERKKEEEEKTGYTRFSLVSIFLVYQGGVDEEEEAHFTKEE